MSRRPQSGSSIRRPAAPMASPPSDSPRKAPSAHLKFSEINKSSLHSSLEQPLSKIKSDRNLINERAASHSDLQAIMAEVERGVAKLQSRPSSTAIYPERSLNAAPTRSPNPPWQRKIAPPNAKPHKMSPPSDVEENPIALPLFDEEQTSYPSLSAGDKAPSRAASSHVSNLPHIGPAPRVASSLRDAKMSRQRSALSVESDHDRVRDGSGDSTARFGISKELSRVLGLDAPESSLWPDIHLDALAADGLRLGLDPPAGADELTAIMSDALVQALGLQAPSTHPESFASPEAVDQDSASEGGAHMSLALMRALGLSASDVGERRSLR